MSGLPVSNLINVEVSLTPTGAQGLSFGVLMIAGDSNVISGLERYRTYTSYESVSEDFGLSAPESLAAALYFGQTPQPQTLMIGRWLSTATSGQNQGGILSPAQQAITNFTPISNGGFDITIDGTPQTLTGINFNGVSNLNGVASAINGVLSGATASWNGENFVITSNSTGAGVNASGTITFTGTGTAADTLTVGGTSIELVASSPTGNEVLIGGTAAATAGNMYTFLSNSSDTNISKCTYSLNGDVITATYKLIGTAGNSFTLAKSSTAITLSGSDLSGGAAASSVSYATTGSGTDISSLLQLTSSLSQALVPGYAAEQPAACASALATMSNVWYGLTFAATASISDAQHLAVCAFIEPLNVTRLYGVTSQETNILSNLVSNDLASEMMNAGYQQAFIQYSSSSPYAVASAFGRLFSTVFTGNNTVITLMYKQEPGVVAENLTPQQALTLQNKNCNVFVEYVNDTMIFQYGVVSAPGPIYIDTIQGLDWIQNAIQTACYNVLYTSTTKIPQTDAGVNQLTNAITGVCNEAVNNGLIAPGTWNAAGFGSLSQGQYLKNGYYIYAEPIALQDETDRANRIAPPIQVALKLAGAIQTMNVIVNVNS